VLGGEKEATLQRDSSLIRKFLTPLRSGATYRGVLLLDLGAGPPLRIGEVLKVTFEDVYKNPYALEEQITDKHFEVSPWDNLELQISPPGHSAASIQREYRQAVRYEWERFTNAERTALCLLNLSRMKEPVLREQLSTRGFEWDQDIVAHLQRSLVSHDFDGLLFILEEYRDAVRERCPSDNTGIISINTSGLRR